MEETFEHILNVLTENNPNDITKVADSLNYLRSGFDLQIAKETSEHLKKHLFCIGENNQKGCIVTEEKR